MYRYGEFETLLVSLHGIAPEQRATLRARIKYYRRLGMFGETVGERNILYSFEDLVFYAFMLEMAQFGLDPQRMVQIAKVVWPQVKDAVFDEDSHLGVDLFFAAKPIVLTSSVVEIQRSLEFRVSGLSCISNTDQRYTFLRTELGMKISERCMLVNLSALHRRARSAVEASQS